jgi:hypothetical protein
LAKAAATSSVTNEAGFLRAQVANSILQEGFRTTLSKNLSYLKESKWSGT